MTDAEIEAALAAEAAYEAAQDAKVEDARRRVFEHDHQIRQGISAIRTAWVKLAAHLNAFDEERGWTLLGYDSLNTWLADPEIELGRTTYLRLTRLYREFIELRQVPAQELEGVAYTKLDVVVPAMKAGYVNVHQAIADARTLGFRDLREEYQRGGLERGFDASAEPARVKCTHCDGHGWVEVDG
jgi:hypothetical protein